MNYPNVAGNFSTRSQPEMDPNTAPPQGAEDILWAMAQGRALTKLQTFSSMAKRLNDQQ
ncbi:hypothetical protein [Janthinobacterium agaricidamnosum]|uniref:Uncharacterized protein n=1 Tax=Janthinobacterium agaricidamnosum NBRC 102515 = DSM 9628 TaxID=1349767 RepID=W0V0C7_9BURK|nr:hypothetical protein [Janthinobacterium agaricidamnosum]CDG82284.1 hypothetical protein GJA_1646 [Janthinobacterium agaricidamnosum NBRC 102515 = DSM 9628]